jgi:Fe-S-cluster containining protein
MYGDRLSRCVDSSCCYLDKNYGLSLSEKGQVKPDEIKILEEVSKNPNNIILSQYQEKVKQLLFDKKFIKSRNDYIHITGDDSKPMIEIAMTAYYPCYFLDIETNACMIYPVRFNICKTTSCEDCFKAK